MSEAGIAVTIEAGGVRVETDTATMQAAAEALKPKSSHATDQLQSYVLRVELIEEEIKASQDDRKEVYAEAKGKGFDVTVMREVVRLRKMDKGKFQTREAIRDLYLSTLKMIG
jgi:uncharacterized protein (UPF0335 family)